MVNTYARTTLLHNGFKFLWNNYVHETAIIHTPLDIGKDNVIGPHCVIGPNVKIGNGCYFHSHVSIGSPPEHKGFWHDCGKGVVFGKNIRVSSFVTIDSGSERVTRIDDNCALLSHSHVGHDVIVERDCTLSCGSKIGGESILMKGCNIGLNAVIHQRQTIGSWAFVGMGATVVKSANVGPGEVWAGNPATFIKVNKIGLERNVVSELDLGSELLRFNSLRNK